MTNQLVVYPSCDSHSQLQQFRQDHEYCTLSYKTYGDASVVVRCAYHAQLIVVPFVWTTANQEQSEARFKR